MATESILLPELLDRLEAFHGPQEPCWPVEPYEFLVWWHCGYPASDAVCERGWQALKKSVGVEPERILKASQTKLAEALKAGGMVPELRAERLQEIARRVVNEFGGDLRGALVGPLPAVRRLLKKFPGIADPGVDRILLFEQIAPLAAVPSNATQVLTRIDLGEEPKDYGASYRHGQAAIQDEVAEQFAARIRAYLLIKQHGQTICKRSKPNCAACPVRGHCAFATKRGIA